MNSNIFNLKTSINKCCACTNCNNEATRYLAIICKPGLEYYCDHCSVDLLWHGIAEDKCCCNNTVRKRAFRISDKTIVVLDGSVVKRFSIDDDTWFIQEEREDGVLLKISKKG